MNIFLSEFFKRVRVLKETGVKISLALGGWYDSQENKYSRLVSSKAARAQFIKHTVKFLQEHDFDGLEIDWEYPRCWQVHNDSDVFFSMRQKEDKLRRYSQPTILKLSFEGFYSSLATSLTYHEKIH